MRRPLLGYSGHLKQHVMLTSAHQVSPVSLKWGRSGPGALRSRLTKGQVSPEDAVGPADGAPGRSRSAARKAGTVEPGAPDICLPP